MISPSVKDAVDLISGLGTLLGFICVGLGWYVTRRESKKKAEHAIDQINLLATNHFPHMTADMAVMKEETLKTNALLTDLKMGQVETNTALRVIAKL